jgi:DNA-binding GntR family transcriptional regulator
VIANEPLVRTMSGQITVRIRKRILSGDYAPGSQLLQDSIAAEYGVSKIPVREALIQLRAEGLVDIFAHRGFQVRPLAIRELDEVFRLRLAIEPGAVAAGAEIASAMDRAVAAEALTLLSQALALNNLKDSGDLNSSFHLSLVVPRLQPASCEILARLHTLSQRYVRIHLRHPGRSERATAEHTAQFAAWKAKQGKQAAKLIRAHIERTHEELATHFAPSVKKSGRHTRAIKRRANRA